MAGDGDGVLGTAVGGVIAGVGLYGNICGLGPLGVVTLSDASIPPSAWGHPQRICRATTMGYHTIVNAIYMYGCYH